MSLGVPTSMLDMTGAFGSVGKDVVDTLSYLKRGQPVKAFETISPTVMANVSKGIRESAQGATTKANRVIFDEKGRPYQPTGIETAAKMAGFTSSRRATMQARQYELKNDISEYNDKKSEIYDE